jgi:hypothetical protein
MTIKSQIISKNRHPSSYGDNPYTTVKKTKRKTSMLQIDIECIDDEYAKKTPAPNTVYQNTPLFATIARISNPKEDNTKMSIL